MLTLIFAPSVRARAENLGALVYVVALGFVVLLFGSVLVHELAHGLMARARGQQPREFVLTLWGGHTAFGGADADARQQRAHRRRRTDRQPACSRPGSSRSPRPVDAVSLVGLLLWSGCLTNAFVGLFNLVPGLPLDGGCLLEAAVWAVTKNRHTGTVAAGWVGRVVAVGVFAWALRAARSCRAASRDLVDVMWAALIGAFLWSGRRPPCAAGGRRGRSARSRWPSRGPARGGRRPHRVDRARRRARRGRGCRRGRDPLARRPTGRLRRPRGGGRRSPPTSPGTTPVTAVAVPLPVGAVVDGTLGGQALVAAVGRGDRSTRRSSRRWWTGGWSG